jgi:hypothetical protein
MAVLPSPSNTSNAPESQGFEANLDDLFLRFAVGPGRQMNINTAPLQAQAIQDIRNTRGFPTGVWSDIFKNRFCRW